MLQREGGARSGADMPVPATGDGMAVARDAVCVGGLAVSRLDRRQSARVTIEAALARRGRDGPCLFFTTVNGQVASLCASDLAVRRLYLEADLIHPDGMSVVFASRLLCRPALRERVATTDVFHDIAEVAQERGARFYFLGANEESNRAAVERVASLYPRLEVVGRRNGYFTAAEEDGVVAAIDAAAPDVLWVGMGVPRQQAFIVRHRARLRRVGVAKTCGGLFDFLAGKSRRAPGWMQAGGLEWLHRLLQDPRRLAWRYLTTNPHAFYVLLTRSGAGGLWPKEASGGIVRTGPSAGNDRRRESHRHL
jgi:exopolysaccharide biosynthesis WecB/TagA/CpsF family protein